MFYELKITVKTFREEGISSFFQKIQTYFSDIFSAVIFLFTRRPEAKPDAIMKFIWQAGRGVVAPGQAKAELSDLLNWMAVRPKPRTVLEIGTCRGGTLFCWCAMSAPDATIVSLDLPGGIHGGGYPPWKILFYKQFAQSKQKLHLLRGDSHDPKMFEAVKQLLPGNALDFLFIDGDHTLEGVRKDYEMFSPLVKPTGTIVFHDICVHRSEYNCHVDKFWNQLKQGREHWEFIENPAQGRYGIGVLTVK